MFTDKFGEVEREIRNVDTETPPGVITPIPPKPKVPKEPNEDDGKPRYRRMVRVKVRDEVYTLLRGQSLSPYIFALVQQQNKKLIAVNVRGGYKALPKGKAERREHCLMQIL